MKNVRKHRDTRLCKLIVKSCIVVDTLYHTTKRFSEKLLAVEMHKTDVKMNKPVYLGQSVLDMSKIVMYEHWFDYAKPKYGVKAKYVTQILTVQLKPEDVYAELMRDGQKKFVTSNYEVNIPLTTGKNKKVIDLMQDELVGHKMEELVALRPLVDNDLVAKRAKGT